MNMKVWATGNELRIKELKEKLSGKAEIKFLKNFSELNKKDVLFDLNLDDHPQNLLNYSEVEGLDVIGCAVKMQLAEMRANLPSTMKCHLTGINALPGFINRSLGEISLLKGEILPGFFNEVNWEVKVVADRVGMVTPRIIFMIINEAFYTLQEGTASEEDIDLSMKLGTNYPKGPFEWLKNTGIKDVYETLKAVHEDTRDERYKICPLLKTRYLLNK
jgi:3-hydroxybutyryl-CoA dehydrogenase